LIDLARSTGLLPDRMTFDPEGAWSTVLQPQKIRRLRRSRRLDGFLVVLVSALTLSLIGLLLVRQSQELTLLQTALRAELEGVRADEGMERSLKDLAARRTVVARKAAVEPRMSELLAAIGRRLPPSMSVAGFDLASGEGRIEIDGASGPEALQALQTVDMIASTKLDASPAGRPAIVNFTLKAKTP
jgi:hypothetical protein